MSDGRPRTLAPGTSARTAPLALPPCRVHSAAATGFARSAEQKGRLWFATSCQCRNSTGSGSEPQLSRVLHRVFLRVAHLVPKTLSYSLYFLLLLRVLRL